MSSDSSTVCTRFVHNAWKKDFCSNCFKSKEEHKTLKASTKQPLKQHQPDATPSKSSIKNGTKKKKYKVSFPKEVSEVIGFGGEWADSDHSSDTDSEEKFQQQQNMQSAISQKACETITMDLAEQDYSKVTKSNTEFNTNINNLIASPPPVESNIKRSFAALKLGSSSPKEAKRETLKITVLPFSTNANKSHSKVTEIKQIFGSSSSLNSGNTPASPVTKKSPLTVSSSPLLGHINGNAAVAHKTEIVSSCKISTVVVNPPAALDTTVKGANSVYTEKPMINNSPEIVSVTEKSLLEEISETLEKNKSIELASKPPAEVVDAMPKKDAIRLEIKNPLNKVLPTPEPVSSSPAGAKRLINRNVPITKDHVKPKISVFAKKFDTQFKEDESDVSDLETSDFYENVKGSGHKAMPPKSSSFFSSQLISDMFLANKPISKHLKSVHSEVYDLSERTYGKITSDGLIMTKSLDGGDANDSHTSSNFDSSSSSSCSDEETNQRSESDSGIVSNEYQNVMVVEQQTTVPEEKCDEDGFFYDDVHSDVSKADSFSVEKSRELAGEPDGSSEPDSNSETPSLPKTSPPTPSTTGAVEDLKQRPESVHSDKPKVPVKPNSFLSRAHSSPVLDTRDEDELDHRRVIEEVEEVDHREEEETKTHQKLVVSRESSIGSIKKGRAPNPPPSPDMSGPVDDHRSMDTEISTIYMRNPMANLKSSSPVIREKDKRGRATVNPKFRSLNSINSFQKNAILNRATTPEPMPRKSLSLSHENLLMDGPGADGKTKSMTKKTKLFSIKKFLRMGSSSTNLSTTASNSKLNEIPAESRSESGSPKAKPRLVIIHPIDINPSAVEVVRSTPTPTSCSTPDIAAKFLSDEKIVSGKPPAPPVRATSIDASKPTRPPPPKSVETRRKQQEHMVAVQDTKASSAKANDSTVYANLGEVRSAIAPRKPERTASMREREERQLELIKKRGAFKARSDDQAATASISEAIINEVHLPGQVMVVHEVMKKDAPASAAPTTTMGGQGKLPASKVEIFERNISHNTAASCGNSNNSQLQNGTGSVGVLLRAKEGQQPNGNTGFVNSDGIKNSVQKMTSTIDNYLKDRQEDQNHNAVVSSVEERPTTNLISNKFNSTNSILKDYGSPSPVVAKKMQFSDSVEMRHYEPVVVQKQDRMSLPDVMDTNGSVYGGSTCSNNYQRQSTPKATSKSFGECVEFPFQ